jgi:hypothetical protein
MDLLVHRAAVSDDLTSCTKTTVAMHPFWCQPGVSAIIEPGALAGGDWESAENPELWEVGDSELGVGIDSIL